MCVYVYKYKHENTQKYIIGKCICGASPKLHILLYSMFYRVKNIDLLKIWTKKK